MTMFFSYDIVMT